MAQASRRTIDLADDQSSFIDEQIAAGRFKTDAEVVSAGLAALRAQDAALDLRLMEDVVPVVEAMRADPSRGRSIEDVFEGIRSLSAERLRSSGHGA